MTISIICHAGSDLSKEEKKQLLGQIDWSKMGIESVDKQVDSLMKLYEWSIEVGDRYSEAKSLEKIGWVKGRQREYEESIYNFKKAAEIFRSLGLKVNEAVQTLGIANVLYSTQKCEEADSTLRLIMPVFQDSNDYSNLAFAYLTMADVQITFMELDSSLVYVNKANELLPKYEDVGGANEFIGREIEAYVTYMKGDFEEAISMYETMLEKSRKTGFTHGVFTSFFYIARIRKTMGQYELAIAQLDSASAHFFNQNNHMRDISYEKSSLYEKMEMNDSAIFYLHQYFAFDDSLQQSVNDELYHEMKVKHDVAQMETEAILNEMKINVLFLMNEKEELFKTWATLICLIVFSLVTLTIVFIRKNIQRKSQLITAQQKQAKAKEILLKGELELKGIKEEQLKQEIKLKNKDLTNLALEIVRKNELSRSTLKQLKQALKKEDKKEVIKDLVFFLQYNLEINKSYEELQDNISKTNKVFVEKLKSAFPKCTKNDTHVAGLIRLGLNSKEIADVKNITVASVEMARHRLRKKLELSNEVNLAEFLSTI